MKPPSTPQKNASPSAIRMNPLTIHENPNAFPLSRVVVCGVGLIGGSFAMALKAAGAVREVIGVGRPNSPSLTEALEKGVIDRAEGHIEAALPGADLVLLATPVGQMPALMQRMALALEPQTVITDAGSTKGDVVAAARAHLAGHLAQLVPGHPIAGAEKSGVGAAFATLFQDRQVVLTPLPETAPWALAQVDQAWAACGALRSHLSPEEHDAVFAAVSHLPHLLAFGLVHELAHRDNAGLLFSHAASGFRDFTRIAASHPEMWRDICLANRPALLTELQAYQATLQQLERLLKTGDGEALAAFFGRARAAREHWAPGRPPFSTAV